MDQEGYGAYLNNTEVGIENHPLKRLRFKTEPELDAKFIPS